MLHLLWDIFKETGQINTYMFYKAMEKVYMHDEIKIKEGPCISEGSSLSHISQTMDDIV